MIRWSVILQLLGLFILGLAFSLLLPTVFAFFNEDEGLVPLAAATFWTFVAGSVLVLLFRPLTQELNHREGIFLVVATWLAASFLGSQPFYFSGYFNSFTDALFESTSGFTTTGASILTDIESLPDSLLLWRSFTHWIGGMGIILLMIAILPLVGVGGMELYRAEFSGARSEKLKPRVAEAAMALWKIYLGLTVAQYTALRLVGLGPFDAICQTFGTVATGGFSNKNESIAAFQSPAVEIVIVLFMIAGGINFTQHYRFWVKGRLGSFWKDLEVRFFLLLLAAATIIITVSVYITSEALTLGQALRHSAFNTTSILTCTGFASADFGRWTPFAQLLLLALMFAGGCTGSTSGGLKSARMVLLTKVVGREFRRMVERRGVFAIRFNQEAISQASIDGLLNLVYLAFMFNFVASLLLTAVGLDIISAISAVAATMFGVGPGLGSVGPAQNYAHIPTLGKWTLTACMIAGRLEFYTLLVIFTRAFWRK